MRPALWLNEVLQVNLHLITEPVLDIGCGKEATLVRFLRSVFGQFHYAPALPFIEQYLPQDKFQILTSAADNNRFTSSVIKKIN